MLGNRDKALKYFSKASNLEMMIQCAFNMEDYQLLKAVSNQIPPGSELLRCVGECLRY